MIVGTYLEEMLKKRRARQVAEAEERDATRGRSDLNAELREWNARRSRGAPRPRKSAPK